MRLIFSRLFLSTVDSLCNDYIGNHDKISSDDKPSFGNN